MSNTTNSGIHILGTGAFTPSITVNNEDFTRIVETSDEWITKRTGMKTRHLSAGEPTWYLGVQAAKKALEQSGVSPAEIDLVLFTTISADFLSPSMACIAARELSIQNAVCYDLNCACTGFVYALDMARRFLATDGATKILIISSERLSAVTDYTDRSTCVLFGDGAAACVLEQKSALFSSFLATDCTGANLLFIRAPQSRHPFITDENAVTIEDGFPQTKDKLYMDGKEVYKFATRAMPEAVEKVCERAGIAVNDLAMIIPHQANTRIVDTAAQKLGIGMERIFCNVEKYGNTSSASIPIALDELNRTGRLHRGDKLCTVGFGAGLTYGAAVFEW
ncbi:MAG: 3-oxoacyl-ACP synthase III family protein [Acetanaerobacterium sp.]